MICKPSVSFHCGMVGRVYSFTLWVFDYTPFYEQSFDIIDLGFNVVLEKLQRKLLSLHLD